jgi:hypothetical protein
VQGVVRSSNLSNFLHCNPNFFLRFAVDAAALPATTILAAACLPSNTTNNVASQPFRKTRQLTSSVKAGKKIDMHKLCRD